MNETDLAARVATRTSMSKASPDATVITVFSAVADALASGRTVTIADFEVFHTRSRSAHHSAPPAPAKESPSRP